MAPKKTAASKAVEPHGYEFGGPYVQFLADSLICTDHLADLEHLAFHSDSPFSATRRPFSAMTFPGVQFPPRSLHRPSQSTILNKKLDGQQMDLQACQVGTCFSR